MHRPSHSSPAVPGALLSTAPTPRLPITAPLSPPFATDSGEEEIPEEEGPHTLPRLVDLGFHVSDTDQGVFYAHDGNDITGLAIYVDDYLITKPLMSLSLIIDSAWALSLHSLI